MKEKMKNIIEKLRKIRLYLPLYFLILLGLDLSFRYFYREIAVTEFLNWKPILFTVCWCFLLTGICVILPKIIKRIYIGLTVALYSLLVLVHCGMSSFFGYVFSFSALRFTGDGAAFFSFDYIYIRKAIFLAVFLAAVLAVLAIILVPSEKYSVPRIISTVLLIAIPITGINLIKAQIFKDSTFLSWDNYKRENAIYENFTDTNESLMLTGLYQYTFRDFCLSFDIYSIFQGNGETIKALDEYYGQKEIDQDNEWTGRFKDKNLILIQLEAIDTWLINDVCMPTLSQIKKESIDFASHYAPMYLPAGTLNTENIVNTGMVSPFTGGKTTIYSRNAYPLSAAHLFSEAGYSANSFHNSGPQVYDRGTIHLNWGYEHYYSGTEMGMGNIEFDSDLIAGYDYMTDSESPFFSFIITYSGHGAYIGSEVSAEYYDKFAQILPEGTNEMVIHAYAHAYETDLFIKALMERLEADGYLDNTVLAFYSDHYDYYVLDDGIIMEQKQVYDSNLIQHTAFFIYDKNTEPYTVTKVTSTIDILPTIVNLFDLNTDGRYYIGNDGMSDNGGYVIFKDYSWYDGTIYWNTSETADMTEEISKRNDEIQKRLKMSWDTMNIDYYLKADIIR